MAQDAFTVDITAAGERLDVVVAGEIDIASGPALAAAVMQRYRAGSGVALDLRGVEFLDSSGLRALLQLRNEVQATGGTVSIVAVSRPVGDVLELTGLGELLSG